MVFKKALLIVDVQNDFCPAGALGVPEGDKIVGVINRYIKIFVQKKLPVFASCDWHPVRTKHFRDFGGTWPAHCIQNTAGAAFHPQLKLPKDKIILYKGMDPQEDSYSVFQAQDINAQPFPKILHNMGIKELYVAGLATDYCVKATVLDALKNSLRVKLLSDAIKGVDLKPDDSKSAIKEMVKKGAQKITLGFLRR